jgi:hypothetical protein
LGEALAKEHAGNGLRLSRNEAQTQKDRFPILSRPRGYSIYENALMKFLLVLLFVATNAPAMDRWTALAMLESGGNDHAIGQAGEVSRYQINPKLWPGGNPFDSQVALTNAERIMSPRMAAFEKSHGRAPDDFEFYVLWNAPAQIDRPHPAVAERAGRFVNLVASADP